MKTKSYTSIRYVAWAMSHKDKYGKITDNYRIPRKLKKSAKKHELI